MKCTHSLKLVIKWVGKVFKLGWSFSNCDQSVPEETELKFEPRTQMTLGNRI